jgi:hypothetical protein
MSLKPNPKEINIILNILKGAQFEFLPRAPFYIDTPLCENPMKHINTPCGQNAETLYRFQCTETANEKFES